MLGELLLPEIEELIELRDFAALREAVADLTPADMGDLFADLPPERVAVIFRILPRDQAARVFEYLPVETQEALLKALGQEQVAGVLNAMAPDDRTALLEELPSEAAQKLIGLLTPDERKVANTLLGYPDESIGRLMTPDYVAVRRDWTISDVMNYIRQVGRDKETLNVVYVTDDKGKLIDDIRLREIVLADPNAHVSDLMNEQFVALKVDDDQEAAVQAFKKYDRVALPVVDSYGVLVGMITVDDVLDVAEQEDTEDIQKMAGMEALDAPYLEIGLLHMVKKRGVWLSVLFLGETLTASAMGHFEKDIEKAAVLALFIPLIISSGGNSGSQASTLITRAMALGEVKLRDWWHVMRREIVSGLLLGGLLASIGIFRIHLWQWFGWSDYTGYYHYVGLAVALALIGVVLWGSLMGSMLPFLLRRLGLDPATSSAPFVATLVDVSGLIIYFYTALLILRGKLL